LFTIILTIGNAKNLFDTIVSTIEPRTIGTKDERELSRSAGENSAAYGKGWLFDPLFCCEISAYDPPGSSAMFTLLSLHLRHTLFTQRITRTLSLGGIVMASVIGRKGSIVPPLETESSHLVAQSG
jgi:hypothetical protein